jgi:[acyl-carrier-protein] S-malonyltransferase
MTRVAYLFPGQGSQAVGMGKALAEAFPDARAAFAEADAALGADGGPALSQLCFEGPEEALKLTRNTQPAILVASVAAWRALRAAGAPDAAFFAGHSLGEYSALVAAGSLALADAVRAVRARGTFMQEAVPAGTGAMAAVLGLDAEKVAAACVETAQASGEVAGPAGALSIVQPANYNSPEQTVIAGAAGAVARAGELCKSRGALKVVPLAVSAPFHCALMDPVKPRLREVLARIEVRAPTAPVVTNVEAAPNADPSRTVDLLVDQVSRPVRWVEIVRRLAQEGVTHVVEVGPGKVLVGLVKRIEKGLPAMAAGDPAGVAAAARTLAGS